MPALAGPINIAQVHAKHTKFERAFERLIERTTQQSGQLAKKHVYQAPHFRPRTGNLQRSTDFKVVRLRSGRRVKIFNTARYAAPIDLGSRPHIIRARRAKALHFFWKGKEWFLKSVKHPGNRPYRFLWHATWAAYRFTGSRLRHGMQFLARNF